ncbi:26S proteasome regulatory subunit, variant 2 [Batrachochytrium dendrobatidis]|nr:26S proteasome regulatory subunit, variant 2 [Batrachochytrium dendrobatidis]
MAPDLMQIERDVNVWLTAQRTAAPADLKDYYSKFADFYDRKLWHQLTVSIEKFAALPAAVPFFLALYDNFIVDFEKKINPISLVKFLIQVAHQMKDPKAALSFLSAQSEKLKEWGVGSKEAYVLAVMETAHYRVVTGDLEGCKIAMEESEKLLDELPATETVISAAFYRVSADYYNYKMAYQQYYHNALLFLSSVNIDDLSIQEKQERAYNLSMSALLGESLYNFSELPILVNTLAFLRQKLCLMTLIEAVFKRSKEMRGKMTFSEISRETRVSLEEVEHLVMKALSLGLIRGKIDQVDSVVIVTWVQSRVLDKSQIKTIHDRLDGWSNKVLEQVTGLEQQESVQSLIVQ